MSYYGYERTGLYRSRDGVVCGVFTGIAEYFDMSAFWTRIIGAFLILSTGFGPGILGYFLAALLMKKDPYVRWEN